MVTVIVMVITVIVVGQALWKRTLRGDLHAECLLGSTPRNSICRAVREAELGRQRGRAVVQLQEMLSSVP